MCIRDSTYSEWLEFMSTPAPLPLPEPLPPVTLPLPVRPLPYYYSRYWRDDWPATRYYDDWRYSTYLDAKYDLPYRYSSAYYPYSTAYNPYYSRYYPWYSRYYAPEATKTVSYDVEKATPYSPPRTVKRETYHSPVGSRTYTSWL